MGRNTVQQREKAGKYFLINHCSSFLLLRFFCIFLWLFFLIFLHTATCWVLCAVVHLTKLLLLFEIAGFLQELIEIHSYPWFGSNYSSRLLLELAFKKFPGSYSFLADWQYLRNIMIIRSTKGWFLSVDIYAEKYIILGLW